MSPKLFPSPRMSHGMNRRKLEAESLETVRLYAKAYNQVSDNLIDSGTKPELIDAIFNQRTSVPRLQADGSFRRPIFEAALLNRHGIPYSKAVPGLSKKGKKTYRGFKPYKYYILRAARQQEAGTPNDNPEPPAFDEGSEVHSEASSSDVGSPRRLSRQPSVAEITTQATASPRITRTLKRCHAKIFRLDSPDVPPNIPNPPPPPPVEVPMDIDDVSDEERESSLPDPEDLQVENPTPEAAAADPPPITAEAVEPVGISAQDAIVNDDESDISRSPSPEAPSLGFDPEQEKLGSALEDFPESDSPKTPQAQPFDIFDDVSTREMDPQDLLRRQFETAVTTHTNLKAVLAEATSDAAQAVYDLAAIQGELRAEEAEFDRLVGQIMFMVRGNKEAFEDMFEEAMAMSKFAWQEDWDADWFSDDEEAEQELRNLERRKRNRRMKKMRFHEAAVRANKRDREEDEQDAAQDPRPSKKSKQVRVEEPEPEELPSVRRKMDKGKGREVSTSPEPERPYSQTSRRRWPSKFMHVDRVDTDPVHELFPKARKAPSPPMEGDTEPEGDDPREDVDDSEAGNEDVEDDADDDSKEEGSAGSDNPEQYAGQTYVFRPPSPPLPAKDLQEHDWENALYQISKYATEHSQWGSDAYDALKEADREPISWLTYAAKHGGEDQVRHVAPGKQPWREWDDALTEENPYIGWSAHLRLPGHRRTSKVPKFFV